jgi:nitroimidazol reductase NimA-like FMN-containing flavoprotein (pyridoxamine 5'-phosphate oxidase superfamily)
MKETEEFANYRWSDRSTLRRHPERGSTKKKTVLEVLGEGLVAHVAWVEQGQAVVIPMGYGLWNEEIVLHGSKASRLMTSLGDGRRVSITVTLLDGLVLARSAFHSSMNYRSAVLFGTCRRVEDHGEKREALDAFVEHVLPGRSQVARSSTDGEISGTEVLAFQIDEATAKVRTGPPVEPESDRGFPVWAGVIPLSLEAETPVSASDLESDFDPPVWRTG